jgi:hypothetical protein
MCKCYELFFICGVIDADRVLFVVCTNCYCSLHFYRHRSTTMKKWNTELGRYQEPGSWFFWNNWGTKILGGWNNWGTNNF